MVIERSRNMNNELHKTRFLWIDLVKVLSIIMVIYHHCPPNSFYGFSSLPLFFFASGLLFNIEKYPSFFTFFKRRSKQLLIPYLCFFTLFYLFWLFVGRSLSSPEEQALPLYTPLLEFLYGRPVNVCLPLWYLPCLFVLQSFFYFFKNINKKITTILILLLPFINSFIDLSDSPWMLDNVCEYFPYYGIACLYRKEIFNIFKEMSNISFIMPVNELFNTITYNFELNKSIKYLASNTVIILACHTYVIRLVDILIINVLGFDSGVYDGNLIFKISLTIFVMLSMYIPIIIINRYLPFIIGKGRLFEKK